jgi:hypothetical protein
LPDYCEEHEMTEEEAFKQLTVEALAGFGWHLSVNDIPDLHSIDAVFVKIGGWWNGLSQDTRDIITDLDLSLGLWNKGWMQEWPAMYSMIAGNPFGRFSNTLENIRLSILNAHGRAADYAAQHAVGKLADDPVLGQQQ